MSLEKFRNYIKIRDKKCLITGYHHEECDVCHLVPLTICEQLQPNLMYDPNNGILLNTTLHRLFDKFKWTFDIYDWVQIKDQYYCKLLVNPNSNPKNSMINQYRNQYVPAPLECFPFMYIHYQIYVNHLLHGQISDANYKSLLNDDLIFKYLCQNPLPIEKLLKHEFLNFIKKNGLIKTKANHYPMHGILNRQTSTQQEDQYLIWWNYYPYQMQSWLKKNFLNRQTSI